MTRLRPKLLYLVTEDWYFCSHRLALARAAQDAGFDVVVVTQETHDGDRIREAGLRLIPLAFARSGRHPMRDLATLIALVRTYRKEAPDLVHHVSLKPVVFGAAAARLSGCKAVVSALTGLGHLFTSRKSGARLLRMLVRPLLARALKAPQNWTILQNPDDRDLLVRMRMLDPDRCSVIRGSGVDLAVYAPGDPPTMPAMVLLVARMLGDKGIREFAAAARLLHGKVAARFVLVGDIDPENPSALPRTEIEGWEREGIVEWWGPRKDMAAVYAQASIVCLPSHREGLPKVLIEAAACGRALVATDVPGCREVVRPGENGLLIPVRDAPALAQALERLLLDPDLCRQMGERSRALAEAEFGIERVVSATLSLYRQLLDAVPAR